MQAWHRFPSRMSARKLDSVTSFHQAKFSREAACSGSRQGNHGLSESPRIHLSSFPKAGIPRDGTHGPSDMATNCFKSGGHNSAAAAAAALSIPQAELCRTNAECVTVAELGSAEGLARWLEARIPAEKPCISSWGVDPRTKRVANLWTELIDGEISLEDSKPPKRTVHVASVKVRNEAGMFLIESHQEMDDGRIRPRNRPLSEKMRPGENVEDACRRGIFEELGPEMGARDRVEMILETYQREEEERDSFSYPGLLTRYVLHTMVASVQGLPSSDFCTQENEGHQFNGAAINGSATNGVATNGSATNGVATNVSATNGVPTHGSATNGATTNVSATNGATTNGSATNGTAKSSDNGHASGSGCAVGVKKHHWKWVTDVELEEIMKRK